MEEKELGEDYLRFCVAQKQIRKPISMPALNTLDASYCCKHRTLILCLQSRCLRIASVNPLKRGVAVESDRASDY